MIVNIITAFSLFVLLCEVAYMIIGYFTKNRAGRITFIRSFKKGKCLIIYLLSIPLYCLGRAYQGAGINPSFDEVIIAFFKSITDAITLVIMRFNLSDISKLLTDNLFYKIVMYFCYFLVIMNTVLFWISIANQRIWAFKEFVKGKLTKKDRMYLFGNNAGNVEIYKSDDKFCKFIIDKISEPDALPLYSNKISYLSDGNFEGLIDYSIKGALRAKRNYVIVINTNDDEKNLSLLAYLCSSIENLALEQKERLFLNLKVFAFGSLKLKAVYEDVVSSAYGVVEYVSVHQKIALDFIDKYPLAKFMNERQLDYKTALIKKDVNVNVIMIGFGKVNRQILLSSIQNNVFITEENGKIVNKKVNYFIFDKDVNDNDKNLNHDLFRYKFEMQDVDADDYLALPGYPCNDEYLKLNINSKDFYEKIKNITSNEKDANYLIVSYGDDLENIDLAQKLIEKRQEWQRDNTVIFVRAKTWKKEKTLLEQEDCIFFGNEKDVVYNFNKLNHNHILKMALMRNRLYSVEKLYHKTGEKLSKLDFEKVLIENNTKWYSKSSQIERESGLYSCLSIKSKLNLLGLTYVKSNDSRPAVSEDEFLRIYADQDMPNYVYKDGERLVDATIFVKNSTRANLAIHEHLRWNAYVISRGIIPATKKAILTEVNNDGKFTNGKNYSLRRHGNITTIDGLIEFRKLISKRDKISEQDADVIKYDYQLLDNAYKLLSDSGYKIVKK